MKGDYDVWERALLKERLAQEELLSSTARSGHPSVRHRVAEKAPMEREQIADILAASEARTDAKFAVAVAELRGDIRELRAASASRGTVIATGVSVVLGVGALLAAFLAFGSQWFGLGLDSSAVARAAAEQAVAAFETSQQQAVPK